jgi:hypothetical protein
MKAWLWVVEIKEQTGFMPTVGCALSRAYGRAELLDWKRRNRDDKFRLVKYRREERRFIYSGGNP